jgi:hypothetical protein
MLIGKKVIIEVFNNFSTFNLFYFNFLVKCDKLCNRVAETSVAKITTRILTQ